VPTTEETSTRPMADRSRVGAVVMSMFPSADAPPAPYQ
jgi:hypothetical protein